MNLQRTLPYPTWIERLNLNSASCKCPQTELLVESHARRVAKGNTTYRGVNVLCLQDREELDV